MFHRQSGLGLVSAIFLIVVVGALVVAITRMVRVAGEEYAQEVVSHRSFLAAESGAQLGLNRIFAPSGTGSCGNWTWDLASLGLPYCAVDVQCTGETVTGGTYYSVRSSGHCEVGGVVAERQVLVRATP